VQVATYIRRRAVATESEPEPSMQAIVISLKDGFYDQASALVGIYRDASQNCSRALTMDLEHFSHVSATTPTPGSGYTR
jgi:structural maintenance of chromosome 1